MHVPIKYLQSMWPYATCCHGNFLHYFASWQRSAGYCLCPMCIQLQYNMNSWVITKGARLCVIMWYCNIASHFTATPVCDNVSVQCWWHRVCAGCGVFAMYETSRKPCTGFGCSIGWGKDVYIHCISPFLSVIVGDITQLCNALMCTKYSLEREFIYSGYCTSC